MKILALEFSSSQRSVAVLSAGKVLGARAPEALAEVVETSGRATRAFGMIESALSQAGLAREQIDCLAIGLGPGSYMGIRVAIAVAQGWQLALGTKLVGLSSADGVAAQAQAEGLTGNIAVAIDAQRGEYYLADYLLDPEGWRAQSTLRLASTDQVLAAQAAGAILIGTELENRFPSARRVFPRAGSLGALAARAQDFVSGEQLVPIYLRETTFVKAPPPRVLPEG